MSRLSDFVAKTFWTKAKPPTFNYIGTSPQRYWIPMEATKTEGGYFELFYALEESLLRSMYYVFYDFFSEDEDEENVLPSSKKYKNASSYSLTDYSLTIDMINVLFSAFNPFVGSLGDTVCDLLFHDGVTYNYCPKPLPLSSMSGLLNVYEFYQQERPGIRFTLHNSNPSIVVNLENDHYICFDHVCLASGLHQTFADLTAFNNLTGSNGIARNWVLWNRLVESLSYMRFHNGGSYYPYVKGMTSAESLVFISLFHKAERCKWLSVITAIKID